MYNHPAAAPTPAPADRDKLDALDKLATVIAAKNTRRHKRKAA